MTQTALPGLVTPPKLPKGTLRIVPLGGLGEIGRNMAVFEIEGKLLIVDCGVLFPEETQPGVDLILPDFSYIENRLDDIVAVVLTHGHEDHIGAVPYLLRLRADIPLVGSQLTLALIEAKLQEHRIRPYTLTVTEGQVEKFGPFECEFVAVNHSIPDALAVFIRTAGGTVLHTGDFKMDQLPLDGRITDLRHFAKLGEEGVDLFMSDSTNADVPGFTTAEKEIGPTLDRLFGQATKRIIVASFSSHVHRVQQVLDCRSQAQPQGRLRWPVHGPQHGHRREARVPRCSGRHPGGHQEHRQPAGQPRGADVHRFAGRADGRAVPDGQRRPPRGGGRGRYRDPGLQPDPGQRERRVPHHQRPAQARRRRDPQGQCKGSRLRPRSRRRAAVLLQHPRTAQRHARPRRDPAPDRQRQDRPRVRRPDREHHPGDNGTVIDLKDHRADVVGQVEVGFVYVDGSSVGEVTEADLKDRQTLGDEGFISIITVINRTTGKVVSGPGNPCPRRGRG